MLQKHHLWCAMYRLWGTDLRLQPSWQMSTNRIPRTFVSNWEPAHNLVHNVVSGAKIAPCLPALAVASLPLYLWQGDEPACSWLTLLWHSLHPLFCEQGRLCLSLVKAFPGKVLSFLFFSLWLSHSLGCYLMLAPSDCPLGIQSQSLP